MKAALLVLGGLVCAANAFALQSQPASPANPVIQVDFSNPGLSPSQWTLTIQPDGSGHFRSEVGKAHEGNA